MKKIITALLSLGVFAIVFMECSDKQLPNVRFEEKADKSGKVINSLQLTIKSDKEIYEAGDLINIQFRVTNVGQDKIKVSWIKFHMLFHVLGPKGLRFDTEHLRNLDYGESDLIEISPGEYKECTFILPWVHDNTQFNKIPGEYKIFATFEPWEDGRNFGVKAWTGTLTSNTIVIKVMGNSGNTRGK